MAGINPSTLVDWRAGALPDDYLAVNRLGLSLGVTMSFLLIVEDESRPIRSVHSLPEAFEDGGELFNGYAKNTIQRLIPRKGKQ